MIIIQFLSENNGLFFDFRFLIFFFFPISFDFCVVSVMDGRKEYNPLDYPSIPLYERSDIRVFFSSQ